MTNHTMASATEAAFAVTPDTVRWGTLPARADEALAEVRAGDRIIIDTVSHEGILEDQGRDPVAFFAAQGVVRSDVLPDAIDIAREVPHRFGVDGPHVVSRPIRVLGAHAGDVLAVRILELTPRVPYGVVSNRHGKGALPDELPRAAAVRSVFARLDAANPGLAVMPRTGLDAVELMNADPSEQSGLRERLWSKTVRFPTSPFLGIMGVTPDTDEHLNSVPPGAFGGNIDVNMMVAGTTLYLPVQVDGAGFYVGDPHFVQGDGEVSLTALEASLQATLQLDVIPAAEATARFGELDGPMVETDDFLVPTGRDLDLDIAVQRCIRQAISLLGHRWGMDEAHAYAYLSAATDFNISQVVDVVKGAHARIRKSDFEG